MQPMSAVWLMEPESLKRLAARAQGPAAPRAEVPYRRLSVVNGVAIVDIVGTIGKLYEDWYTQTSALEVARQLESAAADPDVSCILMHVSSPGGSSDGIYEAANAAWAARSQKRVLAFIEDMGASAAYWIASQAHKVYANAPAWVGSIGSYMVAVDQSKQAERMGLKVHLIATGPQKGAGYPGTEILPEHLAHWQDLVNGTNAFFQAGVTRGRKLAGESLAAVSDGRVWLAADAQRLGLIDALKTLPEVIAEASTAAASPLAARSAAAPPPPPPPDPVKEFEGLLAAKLEASPGMTRAEASFWVRRHFPKLHQDYLDKLNPRALIG